MFGVHALLDVVQRMTAINECTNWIGLLIVMCLLAINEELSSPASQYNPSLCLGPVIFVYHVTSQQN